MDPVIGRHVRAQGVANARQAPIRVAELVKHRDVGDASRGRFFARRLVIALIPRLQLELRSWGKKRPIGILACIVDINFGQSVPRAPPWLRSYDDNLRSAFLAKRLDGLADILDGFLSPPRRVHYYHIGF